MDTIDCRKLSCPEPVIRVKKALEQAADIRVLLDDGPPRENVTRFVRNRGYTVTEERDGAGGWTLYINGGNGTALPHPGAPTMRERVLLITSDRLGDGPEELGDLLMRNFIHTLLETSVRPERIFFMNRGVLLTSEGSPLLEALGKLSTMGTEILSCGLCLDFFGIKEKLRIGGTTNMLTTADALLTAGQVLKL